MVEVQRERLNKPVGSSELARRARAKLRKKLKGTLVQLTISDLMKVVKNRKDLLGSEMGEFRIIKLPRSVPNVNAKSMIFQGEAYSPGDRKKKIPAKSYKPQIVFYQVDFTNEEDKEHPLSAYTKTGDLVWSEQLKSFKHPVMVRCSCLDFFFRWGYPDARKSALTGKDNFRYTRKTPAPPVGRPYQNPKNLPGFCKHVVGLWELLQKRRLLI